MRLAHTAGACVLFLGLVHCAGGPAEPTGTTLRGHWGTIDNGQVLLAADSTAISVMFGCSSIRTTSAIALADDGRFTFWGTYYPSGLIASPRPVAAVKGVVRGDAVELTYDILEDGQPAQTVVLQKGVEPPFDLACAL